MGGAPDDGGKSRLWLIAAVGGAELEEAAAAGEGGAKVMAGPLVFLVFSGTARAGMGGTAGRAADFRAGGQGADLLRELEEATDGSGLWLIASL